ncbi:MAG: SH3 domain-containing protein, partial [Chloroflexota bacterium]
TAVLSGGGDTTPSNAADTFNIVGAPTATLTPTALLTATLTPFPTFPIPIATVLPTLALPTVVPTATLIPNPATRTPLPRPANAGQAIGPIPRPGVTVVVDRDGVNVLLLPAIGAEVIATVNAGFSTEILARSPDNQWVQVMIGGQLGWIGTPVLAIVAGDLNSAPVADPRTIPYGGFENPRSGITGVTSQWTGKLQTSGLRVRGGPSRAYPVLANAPRYTIFSLLGRTADSVWLQVNFEGTLGWVATQFVELQQGPGTLDALPIDGIVADGLPVSEPTGDNYLDTLRFMLARVNLAQPSLDSIRSIWTNVALGQRAQCGSYPVRPTNFNIPNPVLAPFYATLFPLNTDFNSAMTHLRDAIDLLIEACSTPQPAEGLVGQPVVQAALDLINQADTQFASLRQRITALLPPDRPLTDDECLFSFQNRSQIVPRLHYNEVVITRITARNFVIGFCFDAGVGQSLRIEALKVTGNAEPRLTVSSFDNPTNFIAAGDLNTGNTELGAPGLTNAILQPILITQTGRYILILADLDGAVNAPLDGQIALLLTDVTGGTGFGSAGLSIDPATGNVIVVPAGGVSPATPGVGLTPGINLTPVNTPGAG